MIVQRVFAKLFLQQQKRYWLLVGLFVLDIPSFKCGRRIQWFWKSCRQSIYELWKIFERKGRCEAYLMFIYLSNFFSFFSSLFLFLFLHLLSFTVAVAVVFYMT